MVRMQSGRRLNCARTGIYLYPVALSPWLHAPGGEAMHWGLFAFSPLAGAV